MTKTFGGSGAGDAVPVGRSAQAGTVPDSKFELRNDRTGQWVGYFDTLDQARRVIIDSKLRNWSIFKGEELVEHSQSLGDAA